MDDPGHRQAVLGLGIVDAVAAEERHGGLGRRIGTAAQDLAQDLHGQLAHREAHQVEREEGAGPHGPDVGEGVGGGDPAEEEGVVHHRGEEVDRLDDGLLGADPVDGRVVAGLEADEDLGIVRAREAAQDLRQIRRADLAGSTRPVAQLGEPHLVSAGHAEDLSAPSGGGKREERIGSPRREEPAGQQGRHPLRGLEIGERRGVDTD